MLEQHQVATYLLRQGLVHPQAVVDGGFQISDTSRRNANLRVVSRDGPSYFIKQASGPDRVATLAREATFYTFVRSRPKLHALRPYLPDLHSYDPDNALLVLGYVQSAESLLEYHARRGRFPTSLARSLGRALATLHSCDFGLWT